MPLQRPTTTPVPDEIFDEWLAVLGHAELRVLLYIVRRTFGFDKRDGDTISYRQFTAGITTRDGRVLDRGCGVSNRTNVANALRKLEGRGLIRRVAARTPEGDPAVTHYALWFDGGAARGTDDPRDRPARPAAQRLAGGTTAKSGDRGAVAGGSAAAALPGPTAALPRTATAPPRSTAAALRVVPQQYPQETVEQETARQETDRIDRFDGSTPDDDGAGREALRRIVADLSRELGDAAHERANLTRADNLRRATGLPADEFVTLLYEAKGLTRLYQGKQPPGRRIEAKGAYFFTILTQLLAARGLIRPARDPPPPGEADAPTPRIEEGTPCAD